ncbi:CheW-like protein [Methylophaga frappieri]|uniref:CheW-like protein n=2 Tax=Methylophaga frappieri (strain ATCC BAA-2434 / DSM 25690 / JAM7) TaxID=754477 RepID=I1YJ17_METFJ|nr:CheW-like protein [Methylophaga frappieri]
MTAQTYVHCMLIPLSEHFLLLPNTTVAEVIPLPKQLAKQSSRDLLLGNYYWRETMLPVIDLHHFTSISTRTETDRPITKLCILNSIHAHPSRRFFGLPCCGAPQLITLNADALQLEAQDTPQPWLHCQVRIGNKLALIPNMDTIEQHLHQQLSSP